MSDKIKIEKVKGFLIFYVDVGQVSPEVAKSYVEEYKRNFNYEQELGERGFGAIWLPVRANSNTRVEVVVLDAGMLDPVPHCCQKTENK